MCELTIDLLQKRANPFAGLDPKNITVKDLQKSSRDTSLKRNSSWARRCLRKK